jgi:arginine-tRNA-protein transferase
MNKKIEWDEPQSPQEIPLISAALSPQEYEKLLAEGWWHLEAYLWRIMYDFEWHDWENRRRVMHLRYQLQNFLFSKSQRQVFKKNTDLQYVIQPLEYITDEKHILFVKHSERFKKRVPHSILEMTPRWLAPPNMSWECLIYKKNELIACSFFDMTPNTTASIYAMFDPEESHRSLGILTMCLELQHALLHGQKIYYPGYAYFTPSHMDYKKQFHNTEFLDWETMRWTSVGRTLAVRDGFFRENEK